MRADVVFEGELVAVGAPPSVWRSRIATYQPAAYRVLRVLSGEAGDTVTVLHPMVRGATWVDAATPRLDPARFRAGARFTIRAARRERDGALVALEKDGVTPLD